jgi:hypothetical protein
MLAGLDEDWLLIADRNFYNWDDWCTAADTGAALLWRAKADLGLPVLDLLPDGSCRSVLANPKIKGKAREQLVQAARRGEDLDPGKARPVRVIEYEIPDRDGDGKDELIALISTITDPRQAPAATLAQAYHERRENETGNRQLKTYLRGPGRVLRSQSPDMVRLEIYGYLLTHYAISVDNQRADPPGRHRSRHRPGPGQVQAPSGSSAAGAPTRLFPLEQRQRAAAEVKADITRAKNLNPPRRYRTYPRVIKRARHNSYRVKRPGDHGTRHYGPATIKLVNLRPLPLAS